jgi:hypothetical protein
MQESVRQGDEVKKNSMPSSVTPKFSSSRHVKRDAVSSLFSPRAEHSSAYRS